MCVCGKNSFHCFDGHKFQFSYKYGDFTLLFEGSVQNSNIIALLLTHSAHLAYLLAHCCSVVLFLPENPNKDGVEGRANGHCETDQ